MLRAVLALALTGCGDRDCSIDHLVDERIAEAPVTDCGYYETGRDAAPRAPYECAVVAYAERRPFVVRWMAGGIDTVLEGAYVAVMRDGRYAITKYTHEETFFAPTPTHTRACAELIDKGRECGTANSDFCLECVVASEHTCEP